MIFKHPCFKIHFMPRLPEGKFDEPRQHEQGAKKTDPMEAGIKGTVERVTFFNPANNYAVLKIKTAAETVTVTGSFQQVAAGQTFLIQGRWEEHPKYGRQLKASRYEEIPPVTLDAVERYLGSGLIKGIGPAMAKKIVQAFGEQTAHVLDAEPEKLTRIDGIGPKKLTGIRKSLEEQKAVRQMMISLQEFELTPICALKIYKQYGASSVRVLRENPYRLADDIYGIGFLKADAIAARTGVPKDSPFRAEAGILYLLEKLSDEGHVYYPYEELLAECEKNLLIGREVLLKGFASLFERKKIAVEPVITDSASTPGGKAVYLARLHTAENETVNRILLLRDYKKPAPLNKEEALGWVKKHLPFQLTPEQAEAVQKAVSENVSVITGGPGVGKTTIIKAVMEICQRWGKKLLLAAPTGRAAKRLSELTGKEAKTVHRLLEYSPSEQVFLRNAAYPLKADLVVLDEASMVDIQLMANLLKAIPQGCGLALVGDSNQLASVGPGNVLKDIIASGAVPVVRLEKIFRRSGDNLISLNAHKINEGLMPYLPKPEDSGKDTFRLIELSEAADVAEKIIDLCANTLPSRFGLDPVRDIQVLAPMHKGTAGVANLNRRLQAALNRKPSSGMPQDGAPPETGKTLAPGDKVMQIKNDYDKDVFNGDTGVVLSVVKGKVLVDFDGKQVEYERDQLDRLQLAYACSVHKSQGSEYAAVVMPLVMEHYLLLQRNLLYTAVTRAKRIVVLAGSKKALAIAVKNAKTTVRHTMLKQKLQHPQPEK